MRSLPKAAISAALSSLLLLPIAGTAAQEATPAATYSCETATSGSPVAGMPMTGEMPHASGGMHGSTPMAGMDHKAMDTDLMYIDMMIPHHESIIALAEAALPRLQDERLREIAEAVIATQQPEIDELRDLRQAFYGDPDPMPMDNAMMGSMMEVMPGMSGNMDDMALQMNSAALVATFCAAENPDLAFIDLTIPHHQMAIESSEIVAEQAAHPEIRGIAQRVIEVQQAEIATLTEIRADLTGEATPANP